MYNVIKVKAAEIFPVVQEIFKNENSRVSIIITGNSMLPFLREGIDSVELVKPDFAKLRKLDIVLIQRKNGVYILHRLYKKKKDCFYMVGDNQVFIEGPLYPDQLIGVVDTIIRNGKRIPSRSFPLILLAGIWVFALPVRRLLWKVSHKARYVIKKLSYIRSRH